MKVLLYGVIEVNDLDTSESEIEKCVNENLQSACKLNYLNGGIKAVEIEDKAIASISLQATIEGTKFPIGKVIQLNPVTPEDKK